MSTLKKLRGRYLMVLLAMCGLVASSLGILTNVAGIFFSPIARELNQETAAVNLTLTISNLVFALAGILSVRWIKPGNFRAVIVGCTLTFAGSTALLALCRSLLSLYLVNAVRGFSAGCIGHVLATLVIGQWFRADTGFVSSLALGCSGLVGALFNPILESVIQSAGWRTAYLVAAGTILLLNFPAMIFPISFRPEDSGLEPIRNQAGSEPIRTQQETANASSVSAAILPVVLLAFSMASLVSASPQLFKPLADTYGLGETGIVMMSVVLITNTAGKFLFGLMTDRIGVRRSVLIYGLAIAAGILMLLLIRVSAVMLFSAALMGLSYSVPTVGAVMICRELFSPEEYARVYPKISLGVSVANALCYPILGFIYDRTGKYDLALVLVLALTLLSVLGVLWVYRLVRISRQPS